MIHITRGSLPLAPCTLQNCICFRVLLLLLVNLFLPLSFLFLFTWFFPLCHSHCHSMCLVLSHIILILYAHGKKKHNWWSSRILAVTTPLYSKLRHFRSSKVTEVWVFESCFVPYSRSSISFVIRLLNAFWVTFFFNVLGTQCSL